MMTVIEIESRDKSLNSNHSISIFFGPRLFAATVRRGVLFSRCDYLYAKDLAAAHWYADRNARSPRKIRR